MNSSFDSDAPRSAVQRALKLIEALVRNSRPQSLTELAEAVGLPKPSVHRLMVQLEEIGIVQRDLGGRGYVVGPMLKRLANDALVAVAHQPPVREIMRALVAEVNESCNLVAMRGTETTYLERVECDWPLRVHFQAGSRVPLHCTAGGKLLLALMEPEKRRRLIQSLTLDRYTANTITDADRLELECARIADSEVAINCEEYTLGVIGVAVPVLREDATPGAALSIHAPVFRMSLKEAQGAVPKLRAAAERISREMTA